MATHAILILVGSGCLVIAFTALRALMPREGRPMSAWIGTETRATLVSISLLVLMVFGVMLVLKGAFSA